LSLRTWNILLIAALSSATEDWGAMLLAHFQTFAVTYYNELRSFTRSGVGRPEYVAANNMINHSYASVKLWLLLSQKLASRRAVINGNEAGKYLDGLMIWNELWPHFERLVNVFEVDADTGNTSVRFFALQTSIRVVSYSFSLLNSPLQLSHGHLQPIFSFFYDNHEQLFH
jgi:hypothetical protein